MSSSPSADPITGRYDAPFRLEANPTLSPVQKAIERELAAIVRNHSDADARYAAIPDTQRGTIINADSYRDLSAWFAAGRIPPHLIPEMEREVPEFAAVARDPIQTRRLVRTYLTSATTNPASAASKDRILRCVRTAPGPGASQIVTVLNGGSGSGKTRFITANPQVRPAGAITFDSTLTSLEFADQIIAASHAHNRNIAFYFIATDFRSAMERMIGRACTDGRYISATGMANNHAQSRATMVELIAKYRNQPDVKLSVYRSDPNKHTFQSIDSFLVTPYPPAVELAHDAHYIIDQYAPTIPADLLRRCLR
jgi:hypothetical protein